MRNEIQKELDLIVNHITNTVNAEQIFLFGSFADGTDKEDSDFDIYVLMESSEERPIKSMQKINLALAYLDIRPVDIMASYTKDFYKNIYAPTLEKTVMERGVKIYERNLAPS
ncbi:MAG: nucleotidyltransferase domain-containing protein [Clostridia bacterium]